MHLAVIDSDRAAVRLTDYVRGDAAAEPRPGTPPLIGVLAGHDAP